MKSPKFYEIPFTILKPSSNLRKISPFSAYCSLSSSLASKPLVREFVHDRLYHPQLGYFFRPATQVGRVDQAIPLHTFRGFYDYRQYLEKKYPPNSFLTPSELFRPFFGYAIAVYIERLYRRFKRKQRGDTRLNIVEIGPGRGGLALSIVKYFHTFAYDLYKDLHYNAVEISPVLAEQLRVLAAQDLPKEIGGRFQIHQGSIFDYEFKSVSLRDKKRKEESFSNQLVFVIGMEILDNLAHDLLSGRYDKKSGAFKAQSQTRVEIRNQEQGQYELVQEEIQDPLCELLASLMESEPGRDEMLEARKYNKTGGVSGRFIQLLNSLPLLFSRRQRKAQNSQIFAPSGAVALIHHLKSVVPNHRLIMADFDQFGYPMRGRVAGRNAPMVTDKLSQPTQWKNFGSFLVKRGEADICFPSDFYFLRHAYNEICGRKGEQRAVVQKQSQFMKENLEEDWGRTMNGYCPLIEEYVNASFLLS